MAPNYALIAEPDARLASTFEQLVRDVQLSAVVARDGAEAQRILRERGAPALLISNLVLPKVDGFALLAELRRTAPPSTTTAVVVSSSMQLRTTASNLRDKLGIKEVLASSMAVSALRSALTRALGGTARPAEALAARAPEDALRRARIDAPRATASMPTPSVGSLPSAAAGAPASSPGGTPPRLPARTSEPRASIPGGAPPPLRRAQTTGTLPRVVEAAVPLPHTLDPTRLARMASMGLSYDPAPDAALQNLVEETARTLRVPVALVSLVLEKQQWFKAHVGLKGELLAKQGTPLDQSFCRHVVDDDSATPLIVPNAKLHPYFSQNLLVRRGDVGSYAGAPLLTPDGLVLGTLCIIDKQPLAISAEQVDQLVGLARRVAGELELRTTSPTVGKASEPERAAHKQDKASAAAYLDSLDAVLSQLEPGIMLMDLERKITYANRALCALFGLGAGELVGWTHLSLAHRLAASSETPDDLLRRLELHREGPFVLREELELDTPTKRVLRYVAKPIRLPHGIAQLGTFTDVTAEVVHRKANHMPVMFVEDEWPRPSS
ncbi:MAG: hypothetical protein RLZZ450_2521 [Pseudomonadota bacterium]|jgi:PAS domain S-box-containing protein